MSSTHFADHIPGVGVYDRIEELLEFIQNFPDSPLAPIHRREIDYLQGLIEKYGVW